MDEKKRFVGRCPECDCRIGFEEKPDTGVLLTCPECHTQIEVVQNQPLKFDWAFTASADERPWMQAY
jgi:uncharacterized paraquat-inducible protein A